MKEGSAIILYYFIFLFQILTAQISSQKEFLNLLFKMFSDIKTKI